MLTVAGTNLTGSTSCGAMAKRAAVIYWVHGEGRVRKENRGYTISVLGAGGVTATEVIPFNYLHFKKDDDKLEELQSSDIDKSIGK